MESYRLAQASAPFKTLVAAVLALGTASTAGCSVATLGSARPVDVGTHQVVIAPSVVRIARGGDPYLGPQLEIGERYGVSKNADIGVRLWLPMPGYIVDSRIALRRSQDSNSGVDVAVQPGTSYLYVPGGDANSSPLHVATLSLPLLVGLNLGSGRQVVLAAKLLDILAIDTTDGVEPANILSAAATVGLVWPITDSFSLAPELGVGAAILGSLPGYGSNLGVSGTAVQFSLGFLLGGKAAPQMKCVPMPEAATRQD